MALRPARTQPSPRQVMPQATFVLGCPGGVQAAGVVIRVVEAFHGNPRWIGSGRQQHQRHPYGNQPERCPGNDEIRTPHFSLRLVGPRQAAGQAAGWLKVPVHLPHSPRPLRRRRRSRSGCSSTWCSPLLPALFAVPPGPRQVTDQTVDASRFIGRQGRHPISFGCEVAHTFGELWWGVFGGAGGGCCCRRDGGPEGLMRRGPGGTRIGHPCPLTRPPDPRTGINPDRPRERFQQSPGL